MNAVAALLVIDIISPPRCARTVSQQPKEPQISEAARFMSPEATDERTTTP